MGKKYLSEVIDYERDIEPYSLIEIYAGVGAGKNHWVTDLVEQQGKSILLITSRKATAQAQANEIDGDRWINSERLSCQGIGIKSQKKVVVTNAGLEKFVKEKYDPNNEKTHIWKYFDLIILDEAHSLVTDATFTDSPFYVMDFLNWVYRHDKHCKIILMTGTPEPIEEMFSEKTKQSPNFNYLNLYAECNHVDPKNVYLWPSTWIDENIADEIRAGSRMVYFANSITRMTELVTALIKQGIDETCIGIAYSDPSPRNFPASLLEKKEVIRQALLNEKKIPQEIKIFLTTSQNKEGVNIEDDDINIMFSESSERSSLIQMAGRVRKGVDILAIIYDARQHSSRITETSMLLDYCCLDGVRDFWEIACITDLSKGIQDIEKKFDNIRYSYFKKNFFYYLGRELGIEQARADARFLKKCIEEWDWPPIVENDDSGISKGRGFRCFEQWFPYSKVSCWYPTKTRLQGDDENLKSNVREFLENSAYCGKMLSKSEKQEFLAALNDALSSWPFDYGALDIKIPVNQCNRFLNKFGYELAYVPKKRKGTCFQLKKLQNVD